MWRIEDGEKILYGATEKQKQTREHKWRTMNEAGAQRMFTLDSRVGEEGGGGLEGLLAGDCFVIDLTGSLGSVSCLWCLFQK